LVKDLVDIAIAVYAQDRTTPRGPEWSRDMSLTVPVRNKSKWDLHADILGSLLSELTGDVYSVTFSSKQGDVSKQLFHTTNDRPVCLFSGGLDSFVGAATCLKRNPLLVSHYSNNNIVSVQSRLAEALGARGRNLEHRTVRVTLSGPDELREASQLSRSFLFLSIAAAFAIDIESNNIMMFENGPIAINVPISESRVSTRTAHPKVLELFGSFVSDVFGLDMNVCNPFELQTKSEMIQKVVGGPFERSLAKTVSCWRYPRGLISLAKGLHRSLLGRHCGICYPCILRRVAMNAAGLFGRDDHYLVDIFSEYPYANIDRNTLETVLDLLRFSSDLKDLDDISLIQEYPDLSLNVGTVTPEAVIGMYRRFSSETISCFGTRGSASLARDLSGLLETPEVS
jgi:7-cyano-7-deazaguanine synthase in queuosine biosynthesis